MFSVFVLFKWMHQLYYLLFPRALFISAVEIFCCVCKSGWSQSLVYHPRVFGSTSKNPIWNAFKDEINNSFLCFPLTRSVEITEWVVHGKISINNLECHKDRNVRTGIFFLHGMKLCILKTEVMHFENLSRKEQFYMKMFLRYTLN